MNPIFALKRKSLDFLRRLLGITEIQRQLAQLLAQQQHSQLAQNLAQQQQQQHKQILFVLANAMRYSSTPPEEVKSSITYQRCAEVIALLSPMDVKDGNYIRVGKANDGGYVMLDEFGEEKIHAAYSFGICNDVSWDDAIADRAINVFMYDHTIDRLPKNRPEFHYFKTGVTGHKKGDYLKTLSELLATNGHKTCRDLIMKMDVEGCEWDIFNEAASETIDQFSQIVLELHGLSSAIYTQEFQATVDALRKINRTHQSIHVHANNYGLAVWIQKLVLPEVLEVTYVRRADVKDRLISTSRQFPTELDQSNEADCPDIYMENFSADK